MDKKDWADFFQPVKQYETYSRSAGTITDSQMPAMANKEVAALQTETVNNLHQKLIAKEKECKTYPKDSPQYRQCVKEYNDLVDFNNMNYGTTIEHFKLY